MFEAPKGPEHSKIWKALNPDKLYYESRRQKEEAADEAIVVRDCAGGVSRQREQRGGGHSLRRTKGAFQCTTVPLSAG